MRDPIFIRYPPSFDVSVPRNTSKMCRNFVSLILPSVIRTKALEKLNRLRTRHSFVLFRGCHVTPNIDIEYWIMQFASLLTLNVYKSYLSGWEEFNSLEEMRFFVYGCGFDGLKVDVSHFWAFSVTTSDEVIIFIDHESCVLNLKINWIEIEKYDWTKQLSMSLSE